jgi:hypothetical protein
VGDHKRHDFAGESATAGVQIVGYDSGVGDRDPALLVATDGQRTVGHDGHAAPDADALSGGGTVDRVSLAPGTDLAYTLERRHCAGVLDGERHRSCPDERAPYCDAHVHDWVCARCTGSCLKAEMDCFQDHAVYLAAFAPATFKVGVTRLERLETRWREQGADRAAHIHSVSDGRIAREIEAEIATDVGDSVRVPTKIEGLGQPVDEDAWRGLLAAFDPIATADLTYGFALDSRPVADTLLTGTVRGLQGRVLVLDHGGTTYAVDMRDLVGHAVTAGRPDRELQSSLGAFG